MNDSELIKKLKNNQELLKSKETQKQLRKFVIDKNKPLKERFQVWSECCDKKEEQWIIHKGEYGIIGNMVDTCWPGDYDRYQTYTFDYFIGYVEDYHKDGEDEYNKPDGFQIPSIDEFKELLIKTNFGSFTMDW